MAQSSEVRVVQNLEEFNILCDSVALIYHESRNIRHLLHAGLLNPDPWRFVVSLPTNRDAAWHEIVPLRDRAQKTLSVAGALDVFERRFHVSLLDLSEMFSNQNWRHARLYGGNAWARITDLAIQLAEALRNKDGGAAAYGTAKQLKEARHNTGSVQQKIAKLEASYNNRIA